MTAETHHFSKPAEVVWSHEEDVLLGSVEVLSMKCGLSGVGHRAVRAENVYENCRNAWTLDEPCV